VSLAEQTRVGKLGGSSAETRNVIDVITSIAERVQAIQDDPAGAVIVIEQISDVISRISDLRTTIASAVEEQTATIAEMNRSVAEAATADLARMSGELSALVQAFRWQTWVGSGPLQRSPTCT